MRKIRLFFYFLWHYKKNRRREIMNLMEFHENGLAHHLSQYTKKSFNEIQNLIDDIKEKHGYNRNSIAAEETFQVKKDAYKKIK